MTYKRGDIVELAVTANVIPPGRYRFEDESDELFILSVSEGIIIGLARGFWGAFLRKSEGRNNRVIGAKQFLRSYTKICAEGRHLLDAPHPSKLTFCIISPKYRISPFGCTKKR
jgi:hypothetical protein